MQQIASAIYRASLRRFKTVTPRSTLSVFIIYVFFTTLLTWPLIFRVNTILIGDYGDTRGAVWSLWAKINGHRDSQINNLIAAPYGVRSEFGFSQPVIEWLLLLTAKASNEIIAFNLIFFMAFPLTAISTYFLLLRLLKNKIAAFCGGAIFAFSPNAVMQTVGGHGVYAFNVFVPLFMLALFCYKDRRSARSIFYVAGSFSLVTLTSIYFGYFAIYIAVFFVVFDLITNRNQKWWPIIRGYIIVVLVVFFLVVPFQYRAIYQQLILGDEELINMGRIRDLTNLTVYSSRVLEYFTPSINHPIIGPFFEEYARNNLHGSNLFEQTLYLGVVPLGMVIVGLVLFLRQRNTSSLRQYFFFFFLGSLWMYYMSLPPEIDIGSIQFATISNFAYHIAPMFRVYARFGILVSFFLAGLSAVVLAYLSQRLYKFRYYSILIVIFPVLVFDFWSVPMSHSSSIKDTPAVYEWLAKQEGDFIVAEYPMMRSDEASFYTYLFWQRIHQKRLVNGASPDNARAWSLYEQVNDLSKPKTVELLVSAGVRYVIVHPHIFRDGPIPGPLKRYYPPDVANQTYNNGQLPSTNQLPEVHKVLGNSIVYDLLAQN